MAMAMPPIVVIPVHTVVMLGTGLSRTVAMWRYVMRGTLLPFIAGAVIGAVAGANVFVALPMAGAAGDSRRLHPAGDLDAATRARRRRTRPLRGARLRHHVPRRVRERDRVAARPVRGERRADRHNHVATIGALMAVTHIAKLAAFGFIGFAIGSFVPLMAAMIVAGALGNWLGEARPEPHQRGTLPPHSPADPHRARPAPPVERRQRGGLALR